MGTKDKTKDETLIGPEEIEEIEEELEGRLSSGQVTDYLQKKMSSNNQLDYKIYSMTKRQKIVFFIACIAAAGGLFAAIILFR